MSLELFGKQICKAEQMSNWERRPLRKAQQHYAALDAYVLIDIIDHLSKTAKETNKPGLQLDRHIKTLDNRNIIVNEVDDDQDVFDPEKYQEMQQEKIVVNPQNRNVRGKRQNFRKNFGTRNNGEVNKETQAQIQQPYGNSYGRKGRSNNLNLITNEELTASMWRQHGFIVDKNLFKLGRLLQDKGIDCMIPD